LKEKVLNFWNENKPAILFVGKLGGVYLLWKLYVATTYHIPFLDTAREQTNDLVAIILIKIMSAFASILGYETDTSFYRIIVLEGTNGLKIGDHCLGIPAMVIFSMLILVFPGRWKDKLWFIPLGVLLVQGSNLFRLIGLMFMQKYTNETFFEFNHGYTYLIITYGFIFLMIVFWMKKFAHKTS
jgi:exosortase/archaeosortase family protein